MDAWNHDQGPTNVFQTIARQRRIRMSETMENESDYCFGKLEKVFPMGADGLRESPEPCLSCYCKTECLRAAMKGHDGLQVQQEIVDRAYDSGLMRFIDRWSRKKALHRRGRENANGKEKGQNP
jgi:hypothetical protein